MFLSAAAAAFLGRALFTFLLLCGVTLWLAKRLFPGRPLREWFRWNRIRWILLSALLLPAAETLLLSVLGEERRLPSAACRLLLLAGAVLFLWLRCFGSPLPAGARLLRLAGSGAGLLPPAVLLAGILLSVRPPAAAVRGRLAAALWEAGIRCVVAAGTAFAVLLHRRAKSGKVPHEGADRGGSP